MCGFWNFRFASAFALSCAKTCKCNWNFVVLLLLESRNVAVKKFVVLRERPRPHISDLATLTFLEKNIAILLSYAFVILFHLFLQTCSLHFTADCFQVPSLQSNLV